MKFVPLLGSPTRCNTIDCSVKYIIANDINTVVRKGCIYLQLFVIYRSCHDNYIIVLFSQSYTDRLSIFSNFGEMSATHVIQCTSEGDHSIVKPCSDVAAGGLAFDTGIPRSVIQLLSRTEGTFSEINLLGLAFLHGPCQHRKNWDSVIHPCPLSSSHCCC